jgi:hypothetical protein
MDQTGMGCRPSQRSKGALSGERQRRQRARGHVALSQNMYKYPENQIDFHSRLAGCNFNCTLQNLTEVSLPLCLSPHDAFVTYTYLHCPMRLSRLGNLFV